MVEDILNIYAGSFNIILRHTSKNIRIPEKMAFNGFRFFVIILQIFHMSTVLSLKFPIRPSPI